MTLDMPRGLSVCQSRNTSWEHFYRSVADPVLRLQNLHWRPQG